MKIIINPREFSGDTSWESKMEGVVLVEKEDQIDPLWKLLCEQDDYWEDYKDLIKVAPKTIDSVADIKRMCEYCGKTAKQVMEDAQRDLWLSSEEALSYGIIDEIINKK